MLHCHGIPGAGKTLLTSKIIDTLTSKTQEFSLLARETLDRPKLVAYVYFNYGGSAIQTLTNIMGSIVAQAMRASVQAAPAAESLYQIHSRKGTRPSASELRDLLKELGNDRLRMYLIMDALDEYRDPDSVLDLLTGLDHSAVNILLTSRPHILINQRFSNLDRVEIRAHEDDIRSYVDRRLPSLRCIQRRQDLQLLVKDKIAEATDGMFLLARLHFNSLTDKTSPKAIKVTLQAIAKGAENLYQVYDAVISRIRNQSPHSSNLAIKLLSWLVFAIRPLSIEELQHALAIEPESTEFDKDNISNIEDLVLVCKGLVSVDRESEVIRLSHYTAKEYFEKTHDTQLPGAQANIASACLTYLSYDVFARETEDPQIPISEETEDDQISLSDETEDDPFPLFIYAANNWGHHASYAQQVIKVQAYTFFGKERNMQLACLYIPWSRKHDYHSNKGFSGVHFCAFFDLDKLLKDLLDEGRDVDLKDSDDRTPLCWAAYMGSNRVVRFLLQETTADVNCRGSWVEKPSLPQPHYLFTETNWAPLHLAAQYGPHEVIRLLLSHPTIEVNATPDYGRDGKTPLQLAIEYRHLAMFEMLLEHPSIDINAKDVFGRSPLHYACQYSYDRPSFVKMLIVRHDIDPNSREYHGYSPLRMLLENFSRGFRYIHETLMELLLSE